MNGVNFLKTPVPAPCLSSKESIHCVVCTLSSLSTECTCNFSCVSYLHLTLLFLDSYMYELFVDNCSCWDNCQTMLCYGRLVGRLPLRKLVLSHLSFDLQMIHRFLVSLSLMIPGFVLCDSLCWFARKAHWENLLCLRLSVLLARKAHWENLLCLRLLVLVARKAHWENLLCLLWRFCLQEKRTEKICFVCFGGFAYDRWSR